MPLVERHCVRCGYQAESEAEERDDLGRTVIGSIDVPRVVPQPPVADAPVVLEFRQGPFSDRAIPLEQGVWRIGKNPAAAPGSRILAIPEDTFLSREHVQVVVGSAGAVLTDLGSTNGTAINGSRETNGVLVDGDVVRIGESEFCVRVRAEAHR